jgi:hypothetical protein
LYNDAPGGKSGKPEGAGAVRPRSAEAEYLDDRVNQRHVGGTYDRTAHRSRAGRHRILAERGLRRERERERHHNGSDKGLSVRCDAQHVARITRATSARNLATARLDLMIAK